MAKTEENLLFDSLTEKTRANELVWSVNGREDGIRAACTMGDYPVTVYFSRSCFGFGRKNYAEVYVSRAGIKGPLYYEGDRVKRLRGLIEHQDEELQRMGLRKVLGWEW